MLTSWDGSRFFILAPRIRPGCCFSADHRWAFRWQYRHGQACIADVTPPDKRPKRWDSSARPSGWASSWGRRSRHSRRLFASASVLFRGRPFAGESRAGGLGAARKTLTQERRHASHRAGAARRSLHRRTRSFISLLLAATLVSTTGFAFIHILFALFCGDHFGWTVRQTSYAFYLRGLSRRGRAGRTLAAAAGPQYREGARARRQRSCWRSASTCCRARCRRWVSRRLRAPRTRQRTARTDAYRHVVAPTCMAGRKVACSG